MALNFTIDTSDAKKSLDELKQALGNVEQAVQKVDPAATKAEESIKAIGDGAAQASPKLQAMYDDLNKLADSNQKFASTDATAIFAKMTAEAGSASQAMSGMGGSMTEVFGKMMQGAGLIGGIFGDLAKGTAAAVGGVTGLHTAFSLLEKVIPGVGELLTKVGLVLFAKHAIEAAEAVDRFERSIDAFSKTAHAGEEAMGFLAKLAVQNGQSITALMQAYGKFEPALLAAGKTASQAEEMFAKMDNGLRAMGTDPGQFNNFMTQLARSFDNGQVQAGRFVNALAQLGPIQRQLGPEFQNLARSGVLPLSVFDKLAEKLGAMKSPMLSLGEQFRNLATAFTLFEQAVGKGIGDTMTSSVKALAAVFALPVWADFGREMGQLAGAIGAPLVAAFSAAAAAAAGVVGVFNELWKVGVGLVTALNTLTGGALGDLVSGFGSAVSAAWDFAKAIGSGVSEGVDFAMKSLNALANYVRGELSQVWKQFKEDLTTIWNQLALGAQNTADLMIAAFNKLPDWIAGPMQTAWDTMKQGAQNTYDILSSGWQSAMTTMKDAWKSYVDFVDTYAPKGATPAPANNTNQELTGHDLLGHPVKGTPNDWQATKLNFAPDYNSLDPFGTRPSWMNNAGKDAAAARAGKNAGAGDLGGPSGLGYDQYQRPGGQYSGDDLIYGTGAYDNRPGTLQNNPTSPENYNAPGSTPAMPVYLTNPNSTPLDVSNGIPFNQIPMGVNGNTDNTRQFQESVQSFSGTFNSGISGFETAAQAFGSQVGSLASTVSADQGQRAIDTLALATGMNTLDNATTILSDGVKSAADTFMTAGQNLATDLSSLGTDVVGNTDATMRNNEVVYQETVATDASIAALDANTAATDQNNVDLSSGGGGGGGSPGGGGSSGMIDNFGSPIPNVAKDGGWTGPDGFWNGAKAFDDGGLTSGGVPIIAHPNEAVIPLRGGAVPVSLGGDLTETIINVGTLAHEDANKIMAILNNINQSETNALVAFQAISSQMASAASLNASRASSSLSSSASAAAAGNGGGGLVHRGAWGTSSVQQPDGTWKNEGYLPNNSNSVFSFGYGGQKTDATGKPIIMNGAAFGLENTNMLDGMGPQGVPITVHPDEAIIPLPDGRSVPVSFPGGPRPGMATPPPSGGSPTVIHIHVPVRDVTSYGHGPTRDQILSDLRAQMARQFSTIGQTSLIDDPTVRQGAGPYGVRGTAIAGPQIL